MATLIDLIINALVYAGTTILEGVYLALGFVAMERVLEKLFKVDIKLLWIRRKRGKAKPKLPTETVISVEAPILSGEDQVRKAV